MLNQYNKLDMSVPESPENTAQVAARDFLVDAGVVPDDLDIAVFEDPQIFWDQVDGQSCSPATFSFLPGFEDLSPAVQAAITDLRSKVLRIKQQDYAQQVENRKPGELERAVKAVTQWVRNEVDALLTLFKEKKNIDAYSHLLHVYNDHVETGYGSLVLQTMQELQIKIPADLSSDNEENSNYLQKFNVLLIALQRIHVGIEKGDQPEAIKYRVINNLERQFADPKAVLDLIFRVANS